MVVGVALNSASTFVTILASGVVFIGAAATAVQRAVTRTVRPMIKSEMDAVAHDMKTDVTAQMSVVNERISTHMLEEERQMRKAGEVTAALASDVRLIVDSQTSLHHKIDAYDDRLRDTDKRVAFLEGVRKGEGN